MSEEFQMELVLWQKVMLGVFMIPVVLYTLFGFIGGPIMALLILAVSGGATYGCLYLVHTLAWPLQVLAMCVVAVILFKAFEKLTENSFR